ncbi:hypothetical protein DLAC_00817 [Tieghemostelium lacteum]|uniref:NB-ARC domain-containing protein n=1 Tax=Tieghemostelium lacteum TaxID=361077 RepID=A0A152A711_TIELA|nr:hypothetical protein DLAC_00817 [Tieghemostelium lacteum]|eukprot:KYR02023.1 hypothetical protein DLAC_00817 [Tieghemostelium lacteum]
MTEMNSAQPVVGYIGRDQELIEFKELLYKEKIVVLHGKDGVGKESFISQLLNQFDEADDKDYLYDFVLDFSDLNYSVQIVKFQLKPVLQKKSFKSIKDLIMNYVGSRILVIVNNMTQYQDAQIYQELSEYLPIDEQSLQNLRDNVHIIFIRSKEFKELSYLKHYELKNLKTEDDILLYKKYLEFELTDAQLSLATSISQGNPLVTKHISKLLNVHKTGVDSLLENFQGCEDPKLMALRLIYKDFKAGPYLRLFSIFLWYSHYTVKREWIIKIANNENITPHLVEKFIDAMVYYGIWDFEMKFDVTPKLFPQRSTCKLFRSIIEEKKEYFSDFLIMSYRLQPSLGVSDDVLYYRHLFYYLFSQNYPEFKLQKSRILIMCARITESAYLNPQLALKYANQGLDLIRGSNTFIESIAHRYLGVIKKNPQIALYNDAISHYRIYIKMKDEYEIKQHQKPNVLVNNYILNEIGICFENLKMLDKAIESHQQALDILNITEHEKFAEYADTLYYLAKVHFQMKHYKETLYYCSQSIRVAELYGHVVIDQYIYSAKSHYLLGDQKKVKFYLDKIEKLNDEITSAALKQTYRDDFKIFTSTHKPLSIIPVATKYIVTSTLLLSIASFVLFRYFKK